MKPWWLISLLCVVIGCGQVTPPPVFSTQSLVWGDSQLTPDQSAEQWIWPDVSADTVITIWPYALWDQATCHADWPSVITLLGRSFQAPYPPCDQTAYDTWLCAAVQHYQTKAVAWQIIAAPDQQAAPFANFIGSPSSYASVAVHTAQTIRAVDPAAQVMVGEISTTSSDSLIWFAELLARSDVQTHLDLWSAHVTVTTAGEILASLLERTGWTKPVWIVGEDKMFYTSL